MIAALVSRSHSYTAVKPCLYLRKTSVLSSCTGATLPDKELRYNVNFIDSSVTDSVTLDPGTWGDALYVAIYASQGICSTVRSRFERSGNFNPASIGQGGCHAIPPPAGSIVPTFELADSDWVGNAAASGPAFYMVFVRGTLCFDVSCLCVAALSLKNKYRIVRATSSSQSGGACSARM